MLEMYFKIWNPGSDSCTISVWMQKKSYINELTLKKI